MIYTCITGRYDSLLQPAVVDGSFDYICFVREGSGMPSKVGAWKIVEINSSYDDLLLARHVKLCPQKFLEEYTYSLWTDGNVGIADGEVYDIVNRKIASGTVFSSLRHPLRDCSYDEAVKCLRTGRITLWGYVKSVLFLRCRRFPRHAGLLETNVIFRAHHDSAVQNFDALWWKRVRSGPRRDQLSVMWCLREAGVPVDYLLPEEYCARNHPAFKYVNHNA